MIWKKEKIKQCLWWDDVVKGLANQNQSTTDSGAISENESTPSTPTEQNEPEAPPPATLNPNGKAWFIHPISIINYFSAKGALDIIAFYIYLDGRIEKYTPSFIREQNKNKYRYIINTKQGKEGIKIISQDMIVNDYKCDPNTIEPMILNSFN